MNGRVVVDASVAVKWLVNEVDTEAAVELAHSWARSGIQPMAPCLMPVEVADALYRRVVAGELPTQQAIALLDGLLDAGLDFKEPAGLHARAIEIATELRQDAVYDAHYLSLAELMDCQLWTADERFYRAAVSKFKFVRWLGEAGIGP